MHDTPSNISKTFYNEFHYTSLKMNFIFDVSKNIHNKYFPINTPTLKIFYIMWKFGNDRFNWFIKSKQQEIASS